MTNFKIGDELYIDGISGFCYPEWERIKDIAIKYDEDTGEKYQVLIFEGDRKFDARNGKPLTVPFGYFINFDCR